MSEPEPLLQTRVLFITTYPVRDDMQCLNLSVFHELLRLGIAAEVRSWREPKLTIDDLCKYSHVSFMTCVNYNYYIEAFKDFLSVVCHAALQRNPKLKFLNPPAVVLWNSNKIYLDELQAAGFSVPKTIFLSALQPLDYLKFALASRTSPDPVIVKPSISADSGRSAYLVRQPQALTAADEAFLLTLAKQPQSGSTILQEFLPDVSRGEYSLVFIGGDYRYAYLKVPARGEYRVHRDYGGTEELLNDDDVPKEAIRVAQDLCSFVEHKFGMQSPLSYAKIDVVQKAGKFVLIELGLVEPELGFDGNEDMQAAIDEMCKLFEGA